MKNKFSILRVSTYPTNKHNKVGYHSYKISDQKEINTIFLYPKIDGNIIPPKNSIDLIELPSLPSYRGSKSLWLYKIIKINFLIVYKSFRKKIDLVHLHSILYLPTAIFFRLKKKRIFLTFHGEDFQYAKRNYLFRLLIKLIDVITVISPDMIESIKTTTNKEVIYIGNGIEKEIFKDLNLKRNNQIICVASFKEVKGHSILIEAFKKYIDSRKKSNLKLVLAGDGELISNIKLLVEKNDLIDKVIFTGNLTSQELVRIYNKSQYFILTSKREGFPKVILEAISCNCVVISTKVGAVPNVLGKDYPFYIDGFNSNAIFNSLETLTNYDEDLKKANYRNLNLDHNWDKIFKKYLELYKIKDEN